VTTGITTAGYSDRYETCESSSHTRAFEAPQKDPTIGLPKRSGRNTGMDDTSAPLNAYPDLPGPFLIIEGGARRWEQALNAAARSLRGGGVPHRQGVAQLTLVHQ
jgi:hypothetical protein